MKKRTMTNQEIINRLSDICYFLQSRSDINYTDKDHEALCRAAEALENDPHCNQNNCVLTKFGECSYNETGCSDCKIIQKIGKALEAEEIKSNIVPVIVGDEFYKFDGILDRKRQIIYGKPYAAEYVRDVLGMTWKEKDNDIF